MERLIANFQMNSEFFMLMGLFLALTSIVTIIIVLFINRIKTLNGILEQAIEIDEAKISKIKELEEALKNEKIKSLELSREIQFLPRNKEKLKEAKETIFKLQNQLTKESKEFQELLVRCEILEKNYKKLEDKYSNLKTRNEKLLDENSSYLLRIQKMQTQVSEFSML